MRAGFRKIMIVSIAAAGIAASGAVYAHGGGGEGRRSYGRGSGQHMGGYSGGGHMKGYFGGRSSRGRRFRARGYRRGPGLRPYISIALRFRDEIKLSDEQTKKLTDLRDNFYRDMIGERAAMRTMRFDLRKMLKADKVDIKNAEKQIKALSSKRAEMRLNRIRTIERGKAILTGEQYKSLQSLLLERRRAYRSGAMHYGMSGGTGQGMHGGMGPGMHGGTGQGVPESGKSKKF